MSPAPLRWRRVPGEKGNTSAAKVDGVTVLCTWYRQGGGGSTLHLRNDIVTGCHSRWCPSVNLHVCGAERDEAARTIANFVRSCPAPAPWGTS